MSIRAALAQIAPALGDLPRNVASHLDVVARAREGGADLVVFPELSLTGYTVRDMNFELCLRPDAPALAPFVEASRDITIVLGALEESPEYGVYNAAFVFDRGAVRTYRKIYPPDYGLFEERRYVLSGATTRPIDTHLGRVGVLVCEDLWHLSLPMLQALEGAKLLVVISASPTRLGPVGSPTNAEVNSQHHAAICRLLSVNMIFVNRVGYEDGVNFWGGSEVVDAFGTVRVSGPSDAESLLFCDIDETWVRQARRESRHFLDEDPSLTLAELGRILGERGRVA